MRVSTRTKGQRYKANSRSESKVIRRYEKGLQVTKGVVKKNLDGG